MRGRALGSFWEWDELRLIEMEAGRYLKGRDPSDANVVKASRILASIPRVKVVEVTSGDGWFVLAPASGEPTCQVALIGLVRAAEHVGWRVSNLRRRFSPALALHVARLHGWHTLGWTKTWIKVTAPFAFAIERGRQPHLASVDNMLAALGDRPPVMDTGTFQSLSMESISRAMPPEEASQYFMAMR